MASSFEYLEYIIDQLSDLEDINYRYMMGEYIIYYRGRVAGGIYDDRFLIKPVKSALDFIGNAEFETPYPGGRDMIIVDNVDNKEYLKDLFNAMFDELKEPMKKKARVKKKLKKDSKN